MQAFNVSLPLPSTQEIRENQRKKGLLLFKCQNCTISVQKASGREKAARESAFVSQEIQPIDAKQVLFLIMPTCHWSTIWKSGYTSDAVSVELRTRVVRILYS